MTRELKVCYNKKASFILLKEEIMHTHKLSKLVAVVTSISLSFVILNIAIVVASAVTQDVDSKGNLYTSVK
ncbi:MAG: hypothetical protein LBI63_06175 [Candidatus Ancillula sp.]|nr:hypothetical protein [Candidatus Ancillula sp.]